MKKIILAASLFLSVAVIAQKDASTPQAKAAFAKAGSEPFYDTKIKTGRYFIDRVLPDISGHLAKVKTGAGPVMALSADEF